MVDTNFKISPKDDVEFYLDDVRQALIDTSGNDFKLMDVFGILEKKSIITDHLPFCIMIH